MAAPHAAILRYEADPAVATPPRTVAPQADLTLREREVLDLIAEGASNQEIADG
ncbi:LuxR C-terminal-related transcriptional regulator [Nocardia sp. NPDC051570]|uniref:LuxR C-terminal-related transcriptional regulator n=1 Tax=Nocardia sp. NPDC051570 TaxID=3364324 RepID=UPI0037ADA26D